MHYYEKSSNRTTHHSKSMRVKLPRQNFKNTKQRGENTNVFLFIAEQYVQ